MTNVGKRIRELRIQKDLSQVQLAEVLQVRNTTVSAWETGVNEPDLASVVKLANFFGVNTDYLLGLED